MDFLGAPAKTDYATVRHGYNTRMRITSVLARIVFPLLLCAACAGPGPTPAEEAAEQADLSGMCQVRACLCAAPDWMPEMAGGSRPVQWTDGKPTCAAGDVLHLANQEEPTHLQGPLIINVPY